MLPGMAPEQAALWTGPFGPAAIAASLSGRLPRSPPAYPIQVPDLIGVQHRRYLDRTGLQQSRGIADLMRCAALNQNGDNLSAFGDFVAAAAFTSPRRAAGMLDGIGFPDGANRNLVVELRSYVLGRG